ncbi:RNA-directed DNA polymerase [Ruegeria atlantica]|uniref:RNA-directed DNA polymerase n=1 Tax=Ruegeria atlantica TaxID=81569 RepID=UPI00349FE34C
MDATAAQEYLLKPECYFRSDFPPYISFHSILEDVAAVLNNRPYSDFQKPKPNRAFEMSGVNYEIISTKDGRFGWRPYELIHPAIYVTLVQTLCKEANWGLLQARFEELQSGIVECTGFPVLPEPGQLQAGAQVRTWWLLFEQRSLELSLDYTHILQTDVTNCYGSLYTHSIPWAIHGYEAAKADRSRNLFGNEIDKHIRNSRYGQTNGIMQGSVLVDILAELVLAYVDHKISEQLGDSGEFHILRYRDDYRVFAQSDRIATDVVRVISDCLRHVGMKLGEGKTSQSTNIVEASIKPEKLAGIQLEDMDVTQAKTIQKQLLRLHAFARKYPNSGALNRLADQAFEKLSTIDDAPADLSVQVAIVCDIAVISPRTFPALSGILAKLISLAPNQDRPELWERVANKMKRIPHNGHLEIWLQRVTKAKGVELDFDSTEPICQIVSGKPAPLWNNDWIDNDDLITALDTGKVLIGKPEDLAAIPSTDELSLFRQYSEFS